MASFAESERLRMLEENIALMNSLEGFDVVIVCCSGEKQADYWQTRLSAVRGQVLPADAKVLAVFEDWKGDGAGNALGTLYAYQNAVKKAQALYGFDLEAALARREISAALYHTAGKGTRLAPLPGAENNNKPGVKLPSTVSVGGASVPLTILEAVLKQTGVYAPSRKGRLSVFWGDQVFIPTVGVTYTPSHHVDILAALGPMPSAEEWKAKGLEKYGLIAVNSAGEAAQVEKVSHATAKELLASFGEVEKVGVSLGSFSLSADMLSALLDEFEQELQVKEAKLDTDPHLWMPLTLDKGAYVKLMAQKKVAEQESSQHYDRMRKMLESFRGPSSSRLGVFGAVDIGQGAYWWDYGQLRLYFQNSIRVTQGDLEAEHYRAFLGVPSSRISDATTHDTKVDASSVLSSVSLGSGRVSESVLTNVAAAEIEADGAVLVNVTARRIKAGRGAVIYNVVDDSEEGLVLGEKEVLVGVFDGSSKQLRMQSAFDKDGGEWWKKAIRDGQPTFEQVYNANKDVDVSGIEAGSQAAHSALRSVIVGSSRPPSALSE